MDVVVRTGRAAGKRVMTEGGVGESRRKERQRGIPGSLYHLASLGDAIGPV